MEGQITSTVERELGEAAIVVGPVEEGLMHETYEVRFEETDYILQLSEADEEQERALEQGLSCYRLLRDTKIPVPSVVTDTVREFDGRRYTIVEKLPGSTGKRDISPERVRNAGRCLAKIHEVRSFETAGWLLFGDQSLGIETFREGSLDQWRRRKVQDNAESLRAGGLETVGREVAQLFSREYLKSRDGFRAVLCHNDYSPDNILFRNGEVTGTIDFDHAYAGNRYRDLVKVANGFWIHDPCADWDVRATFYEGYQDVNELDYHFKENEPYCRVETLVISVGGMLRVDELSDYEKNFYSERLLEAIERIPRA